jgi:hypothetical protein
MQDLLSIDMVNNVTPEPDVIQQQYKKSEDEKCTKVTIIFDVTNN